MLEQEGDKFDVRERGKIEWVRQSAQRSTLQLEEILRSDCGSDQDKQECRHKKSSISLRRIESLQYALATTSWVLGGDH